MTDNDFVSIENQADILNRVLEKKYLQIELENQKKQLWNLFLKRFYNLVIFLLFLLMTLISLFAYFKITSLS
ncbi:MAG: hypothetical protein VW827_03590 [Alphaproteobacteria bacterium]